MTVLDGILSVTLLTAVTEIVNTLSSSTGERELLMIVYPLREPLFSVKVTGGKGNGLESVHSLIS